MELAERLSALMVERDWNQSDLGRAAGLPREQISAYMRGRSFPTNHSLARLAAAFNMTPETLLPTTRTLTNTKRTPAFEMRQESPGSSLWTVYVYQTVRADQALRIANILAETAPPTA